MGKCAEPVAFRPLLACACLLLSACAQPWAPDEVQGARFAGPAATPKGQEYMPDAARKAGVDGEALLLCLPQPGGGVVDCAVQREEPPGWGFGAAALRLAPSYRRSGEERRVAGRIVVRVRFCHDRRVACRRAISQPMQGLA